MIFEFNFNDVKKYIDNSEESGLLGALSKLSDAASIFSPLLPRPLSSILDSMQSTVEKAKKIVEFFKPKKEASYIERAERIKCAYGFICFSSFFEALSSSLEKDALKVLCPKTDNAKKEKSNTDAYTLRPSIESKFSLKAPYADEVMSHQDVKEFLLDFYTKTANTLINTLDGINLNPAPSSLTTATSSLTTSPFAPSSLTTAPSSLATSPSAPSAPSSLATATSSPVPATSSPVPAPIKSKSAESGGKGKDGKVITKEEIIDRIKNVPKMAVEIYEAQHINLSSTYKEFEIYNSLVESAATNIRLDIGFSRLSALLSDIHSAPENEANQIAAELKKLYKNDVIEPIISENDKNNTIIQGASNGSLTFPRIVDAFIPQAFKCLRYDSNVEGRSLEDDSLWQDRTLRQDLTAFFARYLGSPLSIEYPLIVLGHPGSGKSMLSKMLSASISSKEYTVIRIPLRDTNISDDIHDTVKKQIERETRRALTGGYAGFSEHFTKKPLFIIFDGYDELLQCAGRVHSEYLKKIRAFQEQEKNQGRPLRVMITSRINLIDSATIPRNSTILRLMEFDEQRRNAFIEKWNEVNSDYYKEKGIKPFSLQAEEEMEKSIKELAEQPLLLLMLALYDSEGNALLNRLSRGIKRTDLYDDLLRRFCSRERHRLLDPNDRLNLDSVSEEMRRLGVVAIGMFNRRSLSVRSEELNQDLALYKYTLSPSTQNNNTQSHQHLNFASAQAHHYYGSGSASQNNDYDGGMARQSLSFASQHDRLTEAEALIGNFFFVRKYEAKTGVNFASNDISRGDGREEVETHRAYEFLHNTFGEFLTADFILHYILKVTAEYCRALESTHDIQKIKRANEMLHEPNGLANEWFLNLMFTPLHSRPVILKMILEHLPTALSHAHLSESCFKRGFVDLVNAQLKMFLKNRDLANIMKNNHFRDTSLLCKISTYTMNLIVLAALLSEDGYVFDEKEFGTETCRTDTLGGTYTRGGTGTRGDTYTRGGTGTRGGDETLGDTYTRGGAETLGGAYTRGGTYTRGEADTWDDTDTLPFEKLTNLWRACFSVKSLTGLSAVMKAERLGNEVRIRCYNHYVDEKLQLNDIEAQLSIANAFSDKLALGLAAIQTPRACHIIGMREEDVIRQIEGADNHLAATYILTLIRKELYYYRGSPDFKRINALISSLIREINFIFNSIKKEENYNKLNWDVVAAFFEVIEVALSRKMLYFETKKAVFDIVNCIFEEMISAGHIRIVDATMRRIVLLIDESTENIWTPHTLKPLNYITSDVLFRHIIEIEWHKNLNMSHVELSELLGVFIDFNGMLELNSGGIAEYLKTDPAFISRAVLNEMEMETRSSIASKYLEAFYELCFKNSEESELEHFGLETLMYALKIAQSHSANRGDTKGRILDAIYSLVTSGHFNWKPILYNRRLINNVLKIDDEGIFRAFSEGIFKCCVNNELKDKRFWRLSAYQAHQLIEVYKAYIERGAEKTPLLEETRQLICDFLERCSAEININKLSESELSNLNWFKNTQLKKPT